MRRKVATAFCALALGWVTGPALAGDILYSVMPAGAETPRAAAQPKDSTTVITPGTSAPRMMPAEGSTVVTSPGMPGPMMPGSGGGECATCQDGQCCPNCEAGEEGCCHFVGAVGFYLLSPHGQNNVAWRQHMEGTNPDGSFFAHNTVTNFDPDTEIGPRFWIGFEDACGLGVRARYFHWDDDTDLSVVNDCPPASPALACTLISAAPFFGQPGFHAGGVHVPPDNEAEAIPDIDAGSGKTLLLHNRIRIDAVDVEVTQSFKPGRWYLLATGGIRYAQIKQDYTATMVNTLPIAPNNTLEILNSSNKIDGVGPTVSLELHRPIGNFGLALYGTARGSLLFGDRKDHADFTRFSFLTGAPVIAETFDNNHDDVLPVTEIELGVEWFGQWNGISPFVQVGFVGQNWFNAGSATSETGNLGLMGMTLNAGLLF